MMPMGRESETLKADGTLLSIPERPGAKMLLARHLSVVALDGRDKETLWFMLYRKTLY
jgi:hypothetical protein